MLLGANLLCILYQVVFSPLLSGNDAWGIGIVSFLVVEYGGGDLSLSKPKTVDLIA